MWSLYDETNNRAEALNGFIQQLKTANRQKGLLIGDQVLKTGDIFRSVTTLLTETHQKQRITP